MANAVQARTGAPAQLTLTDAAARQLANATSLYCSLAVLTPDALAVLDNVEVGKFHEYAHTYR